MIEDEKIMQLPSTGERFLPEWGGDSELEHIHRYVLACELIEDMDVLDIASGEGYGSSMLAEKANTVIGVDISQETIKHAKRKYSGKNLKFMVGGCDKIPMPDSSVDAVVSFETIEHHDLHDEMISEIKRVLKPTGILIISSPDKRNYSEGPGIENPYHVKELYEEEFKELINNNFKETSFFGQRITHGSYVVNDDKIDSLVSYKKNPKNLEKNTSNNSPVFWIALASDIKLPHLSSSVFETHLDEVTSLKSVLTDRNDYISHLENSIKSRDSEIVGAKDVVSERDNFISYLQLTLNEQNDRIVRDAATIINQEKHIEFQHKYVVHLEGVSEENTKTIGRYHEVVIDRNSYIHHLENTLAQYDLDVAQLKSVNQEFKIQLNKLNEEIFSRDKIVTDMYNSRSWRITAPLRRLRNSASYNHIPYHDTLPPKLPVVTSSNSNTPAFFTICSKNFLAHARVLYTSVKEHYPLSRFFVVLCDKLDGYIAVSYTHLTLPTIYSV